MGRLSRPGIAVAAGLWMVGACGGSAADRPAGRSLSGDALADWGATGHEVASAPTDAPPARPPSIELAGGDRFVAMTALVEFQGGGESVCSLYALRQTESGLAEGRRTIDCPAGGLAAVVPDAVRLLPVDAPRWTDLERALTGAALTPEPAPAAADPPPSERISVRVVTDRRTVEGVASPVAWPSPIEGVPEPAYDHEPTTLSELYEAVMYPRRFRR